MNEKISILNLEDNIYDAELIKKTILREKIECDILRVETKNDFIENIKNSKIDLILADYSLPLFNGLQALELAREFCPEIPFIFVTGALGEEVAIETLKKGATDYVIKDRLSRLVPAILRAIKEKEEITAKNIAQNKILEDLREREILLKEIHHRVQNNLQIMISLLNLQINYISNKETIKILKDNQKRIMSMALVHQHLYQSSNFSKIDIKEYIISITNNLLSSYNSFNHIGAFYDLDNIYLGIEQTIPIGLIVNELLTNIFIHAFPKNYETAKILISVKKEDEEMITLKISDNGTGMPENFDPYKSKSFGIELVNILIGQIDGSFQLEKTPGTTWIINFLMDNSD